MCKINRCFILVFASVILLLLLLFGYSGAAFYSPLLKSNVGDNNLEVLNLSSAPDLIVTVATSKREYQVGEVVSLTDEEGSLGGIKVPNLSPAPNYNGKDMDGKSLTGRFISKFEDFFDENKPAVVTQYFQKKDGKIFEIVNEKKFPSWKNVEVSGSFLDDSVNIKDFLIDTRQENFNSTLGEQRTLTILVYDEEGSANDLPSPNEIYQAVFSESDDSVNKYMREVSYDRAWYAGDVTSWYPISGEVEPGAIMSVNDQQNPHILFGGDSFSYSNSSLEILEIQYPLNGSDNYVVVRFSPFGSSQSFNITLSESESETRIVDGEEFTIRADQIRPPQQYLVEKAMSTSDSKVNFEKYDRLLIVWDGPMPFGGVGATPQIYLTQEGAVSLSHAIVRWDSLPKLISTARHELGHSMGLPHANYWDCGAESIGEQCISWQYLNWRDVMGQSYLNGHYNSVFKDFLGWFRQDEILSSPNYGLHKILPLSSGKQGSKVLKIPLENNLNYYVEFRRPIGYDQEFMKQEGKELNDGAILLYDFLDSNLFFSQVIDSTPKDIWLGEDPDEFLENSKDVVLRKGETFIDAENNVALTTYQVGKTGLIISYSPKKKSVITNLENKDVYGYLSLKIQKSKEGKWFDESVLIEGRGLNIAKNNVLALDNVWKSIRWAPQEIGKYRAVAKFEVSSDNSVAHLNGGVGENPYVWEDNFEFDVYDCGDSICQENEFCIKDDDVCENAVCFVSSCSGGCVSFPIGNGGEGEGCQNDIGCEGGDCVCDGGGICISNSTNNRVFITSNESQGDFGGIDVADTVCQNLADEASLGGQWRAWLSETGNSISQRLDHSIQPYVLIDGTIIADNWGDLTDGDLNVGIEIDERGELVQQSFVLTGTNEDGSFNDANCEDWTSTEGNGRIGYNSWPNNGLWTSLSNGLCFGEFRFYCFEQ